MIPTDTIAHDPTVLEAGAHSGVSMSAWVKNFALENGLSGEAVKELTARIATEARNHRPLAAHGHEDHGHGHDDHDHEGHGHHEEGAMPVFSMAKVLQRYGEPQAEVHIGWADIYLDLILVGVAFNGGLLLKHAFYLCTPPHLSHHAAGEHGAAHGAVHADEHGAAHGAVADEHGAVHVISHAHRLLSGEDPADEHAHAHPECLGLGVGLLHVVAFGLPIIGAWLKETTYRARFEEHALFGRFLECGCYLLMIIGASCEEDVTVLQADGTFWETFTLCMLVIDLSWVMRYGVIFFHEEPCARKTAMQRIVLLLPGLLCYFLAFFLASYPVYSDLLLGSAGLGSAGTSIHIWYIPTLLVAGANTPLFIEFFGYALCSYTPAMPINVHFVLHRCTEVFMVLLGESVLQLITSQSPEPPPGSSHEDEILAEEKFATLQMVGFVITLTIMHSFVTSEPEAEHHVLNRGGPAGQLWLILFLAKAVAVWLVGIGIKIALYDPNASGYAFYSYDQRLQFGASLASCYFLGGVMSWLHSKSIADHFEFYVLQSPVGIVAFVGWIGIVAFMAYLPLVTIDIYEYVIYQCLIGLLHMVLAQLERVWLPAGGYHFKAQEVVGHPDSGKSVAKIYHESQKDLVALM